MNRTRLDEIVEEAAGIYGFKAALIDTPNLRKFADLVAQQVFRHGVEQSIAAIQVITGHTFDCEGKSALELVRMGAVAAEKQIHGVQPAPAEEKWVQRISSSGISHINLTKFGNPRKGERRGAGCGSYDIWRSLDTTICGTRYYFAPISHRNGKPLPSSTKEECAYFRDRRSGKDRRK